MKRTILIILMLLMASGTRASDANPTGGMDKLSRMSVERMSRYDFSEEAARTNGQIETGLGEMTARDDLIYITPGYKLMPMPYYETGPDGTIILSYGCPETVDILAILKECLEYIEDGTIDRNMQMSTTLGIYIPLTRDGLADDAISRAQEYAERCRKETALHNKIKEIIRQLEK